eukprot:scaffold1681_cov105-Isochrysis_galbana.AAC.10
MLDLGPFFKARGKAGRLVGSSRFGLCMGMIARHACCVGTVDVDRGLWASAAWPVVCCGVYIRVQVKCGAASLWRDCVYAWVRVEGLDKRQGGWGRRSLCVRCRWLTLSRFSHEIGGLERVVLRSGRNGLLSTGASSTSESDSMETTGEAVGVRSTASEFRTKAAEDAPAEVKVKRCSTPRGVWSLSHTRRATRRGRNLLHVDEHDVARRGGLGGWSLRRHSFEG